MYGIGFLGAFRFDGYNELSRLNSPVIIEIYVNLIQFSGAVSVVISLLIGFLEMEAE